LAVKDCLQMLAEPVGVRLQIVTNEEQLNYVDRLFALRASLAHFESVIHIATEEDQEKSAGDQVWLTIPAASLQDLIVKPVCAAEEVADWKLFFKKKKVVLPDGIVLNYYDGGQGGKTLVVLNAYGQSFGYWERFLRAVSNRFHIILWLPRASDAETIGLKVAAPQAVHAEDLERVLSQEGVECCTLLAWCSGPKLALEYYSRHPAPGLLNAVCGCIIQRFARAKGPGNGIRKEPGVIAGSNRAISGDG